MKLLLYVLACIMPFCLHSHCDCIFYESILDFGLKLFLENSICMQQSKDPNKKSNLIFGRRNSKTIKLATMNISSSFTLKMFAMYFWDHPLKCDYRESYDIKRDWYSLKPTYHIKTSHVIYNEN